MKTITIVRECTAHIGCCKMSKTIQVDDEDYEELLEMDPVEQWDTLAEYFETYVSLPYTYKLEDQR